MDDPARARLLAMFDRAARERVPVSGSIAMTHRCHLRCLHCYLGPERYAPPEGGERDTAFWLSVIEQVAEAGCLNLLITGGEPLLRSDFAEIYALARGRGLLVTVFTNGTLVDDRIVALFDELPPEMVEITLYGASAPCYERVTGAPGSYARCLSGVDTLLGKDVVVGLKAVILTENSHEIPAMREMARARGVPFRVDAALFPDRDGRRLPLEHRIAPAEAVSIEMQDERLLARTAEYHRQTLGAPAGDRLFGCMAGVTGFHVDPRGTLLPCLMVSTHGFDLRRGSFREGWGGVLSSFSEQAVAPGYECHACDKRFLCGVCPAQAGMETGSVFRKAEYLCRLAEARLVAISALVDTPAEADVPSAHAGPAEGAIRET